MSEKWRAWVAGPGAKQGAVVAVAEAQGSAAARAVEDAERVKGTSAGLAVTASGAAKVRLVDRDEPAQEDVKVSAGLAVAGSGDKATSRIEVVESGRSTRKW
jgi:hypothetical protein